MNSIIKLDQIRVGYGGNTVLNEISFTVPQGEFLGIIGPNGAGKTTMFRVILGLLEPHSGKLSIKTEQGAALPASAIGYVPQSRLIDPETPIQARDFVSLGLPHKYRPWLSAKDRKTVEEALELTGASHLAKKSIGKLSGGEKQRIFLAQALVRHPRILLLDEPTSNLDPGAQETLASIVHRVSRSHRISVLFISHDINLIAKVADRILYLTKGDHAIGTIDEVIRTDVLSKLYGTPVEVNRANSRLIVTTNPTEAGSTICFHGEPLEPSEATS